MGDFKQWETKFDKQDLVDFTFNREALLWLKLKSISKKEPQNDFFQFSGISPQTTGVKKIWCELFDTMKNDIEGSIRLLDDFSEAENQKQLSVLDIETLSNDLYKVQSFKWGGDHTNSLDKYLVTRYVKAIISYDELQSKVPEIGDAAYGYVMSSWYNHWSSILIEHVFKSHVSVIPTVGQVKGVDFFVDGIPFDLKVTHLPKGFIDQILKAKNYKPELTYLKSQAKALGITFDKDASDDVINYQIIAKLKDVNTQAANDVLDTTKNRRQEILSYALDNPKELSKWLYENQGDMRFGAENRLFLVLIDNDNWDNSWSLKRNINLLRPKIMGYLDSFSSENIEDMKIEFTFKSHLYTTYADILFIIKD